MHGAFLTLIPLLLWTVPSLAQQTPLAAGAADGSLGARAARPLALEDYYRVKSVDSPRISPDGQWVSYSVGTRVEETNGTITETWLVRADGSAQPVRVRHQGENVSNPRWRDDGQLLFTHGDATWAIDPSRPAGPAVRAEGLDEAAAASPDGRWRARTREVPATARPDVAMSEFERRHEERFKGDAFDWYPFRQDGQRFPLQNPREVPAREIFVESAEENAAARQLTQLGLQAGNLRWTPDGQAILFTANEGFLDERAYGSTDIFQVSLDGELTRLTQDGYNYSGVDFSPDGRWRSYVRSFGTDMIIDLRLGHGGEQDIYIEPVAGGEPINLTADFDLDAGRPYWSPDSRHLYFSTGIGGATHLFRVPVTGGAVEQVTTGERRVSEIDFDRAFRRITYIAGEFDRPPDVWVADIDGRNEKRLTDVHREFLQEVEIATHPSQAVRWTSYDGTPIEGFLLFPHGYDPDGGPYPLIVMNHGGPHSASGYGFNFKNALFTANGYFVFLPNFRSSTGYGTAFKWGTWGGWGNNDGEDVVSGIDALVARFPIDRGRVGSTGHSYGGILTNWLITRYPDRFKAAVSGAGESNWTSNFALSDVARTKELEFLGPPWDPRAREIMIAQSPALNCGQTRAATLFVHGDVDYRVPIEGAIQLYTCLKKLGLPSKLIIYEGMPHSISGHWNNIHRMMHELRWWETHLKPTSPAPRTSDGG